MNLHETAILLAALLLVYHQVTTWFSFFPWNDVATYSRRELLLEASFNGLMMGTGLACLLLGTTGFFRWYPLLYYPFLFLGECMDWWVPYFSEPFARARNLWDYEAKFSQTVKLIPHKLGKRTPDANHIVLHCLTLLTLVVVYWERLGRS